MQKSVTGPPSYSKLHLYPSTYAEGCVPYRRHAHDDQQKSRFVGAHIPYPMFDLAQPSLRRILRPDFPIIVSTTFHNHPCRAQLLSFLSGPEHAWLVRRFT